MKPNKETDKQQPTIEQQPSCESNKRLIFDIEADGLLPTVKQIHCVVILELPAGQWEGSETTQLSHSNKATPSTMAQRLRPQLQKYGPDQIPEAIAELKSAQTLVGHNIIGYDLPAIWKCRGGWNEVPLILDTLVVSRFLWPERPWGHALASWGEHLGNPKIEFDQWDEFSEEMLEYCAQDVSVNYDIFKALEKEHGSPLQGYSVY